MDKPQLRDITRANLREFFWDSQVDAETKLKVLRAIYAVEIGQGDSQLHQITQQEHGNIEAIVNSVNTILERRVDSNYYQLNQICELFNAHLLPAGADPIHIDSFVLVDSGCTGAYISDIQGQTGYDQPFLIGIAIINISNTGLALEYVLHEYIHFYGLTRTKANMHTTGGVVLRDFLEFLNVSLTLEIKRKAIAESPSIREVLPESHIDGGYQTLYSSIEFLLMALDLDLGSAEISRMGMAQNPMELISRCNDRLVSLDETEYLDLINTLFLDFRISRDQKDYLSTHRAPTISHLYLAIREYTELLVMNRAEF